MKIDLAAAAMSAVHAKSRHRSTNPTAWLPALSWLYVVFVIAVVLFMRLAGEHWWLATLMLFGPRWIYLVPLVALFGWAGCYRRCSLLPVGIAGSVIVGPLMGLCLPWGRLTTPNRPPVGILSCNVKGSCTKNDRLNAVVRQSGIDVVVLQGCTEPLDVDWPAEWNVLQRGELVIASRYPLRHIVPPIDLGYNNDHREKVLLGAVVLPYAELRLATLRLLSPHNGISAVINRRDGLQPERSGFVEIESEERWRQSQVISRGLADDARIDVVVGDFNLTSDNPIYRKLWSSFTDAFETCGLGFGGTERPNRWLPFSIRIDHILTRGAWRPGNCWVGDDVGSDHRPIIAQVYLAGGG